MSLKKAFYNKIVKGSILGIVFALSFFLLVNLFVMLDPRLRVSLGEIFAYKTVFLQLLKTIVLISLAGGTIGALVGVLISLANEKNVFSRLAYGIIAGAIWGMVSGVMIFRDATALIWTLLCGIPLALLISVFLRN